MTTETFSAYCEQCGEVVPMQRTRQVTAGGQVLVDFTECVPMKHPQELRDR